MPNNMTDAISALSLIADSELPEREARILELRHGFGSGESMSLQQVGNTMALSRERVRQLEVRALAQLKAMLEPLRDHAETDLIPAKFGQFQIRSV